MQINKIKAWLDNIYYNVGGQQYDFKLQWSDQEGIEIQGNKITHGKWKKFSEICFDPENSKNRWFLEHANQRQILPIEVVLDLESEDQLNPTIQKLKELGMKFYPFSTGSRGYHIHLFFNRELKEAEKLAIIKYFKADERKASNKCLIALEFAPHWKSRKIKEIIEEVRT